MSARELQLLTEVPGWFDHNLWRSFVSTAQSQNVVERVWRTVRLWQPAFTLLTFWQKLPSLVREHLKRVFGYEALGYHYETGSVSALDYQHVALEPSQARALLLRLLDFQHNFAQPADTWTPAVQQKVLRKLSELDVDRVAYQGAPRQRRRAPAGSLQPAAIQ